MAKLGEVNFVKAIGPDGARHALRKPFSDAACGRYLADLGVVLDLLPPPPARVLDLGVGSGWTSVLLARRGYDVTGVDICPDMIELARRNRDEAGVAVEFVVGDYESVRARGRFDAALFYDALHHAEDERAALAATFAALRPGGVCLTVEPGEGHAAGSAAAAGRLGVTEKELPPRHLIAVGRAVGFRSFRVYPRAAEPRAVFRFDRSAPPRANRPSRWRVAWRFALKAARAALAGVRDGDREFLHRLAPESALRLGNIVRMEA